MTRGSFPHLLARHLRFQRDLLALRRLTLRFRHSLARDNPRPTGADWEPWITARQDLLARLQDHDGAGLVADTIRLLQSGAGHPLAPPLRALCHRALAMADQIAEAERRVGAALRRELLDVTRRLLSTGGAQRARRHYGRTGAPRRLSGGLDTRG